MVTRLSMVKLRSLVTRELEVVLEQGPLGWKNSSLGVMPLYYGLTAVKVTGVYLYCASV